MFSEVISVKTVKPISDKMTVIEGCYKNHSFKEGDKYKSKFSWVEVSFGGLQAKWALSAKPRDRVQVGGRLEIHSYPKNDGGKGFKACISFSEYRNLGPAPENNQNQSRSASQENRNNPPPPQHPAEDLPGHQPLLPEDDLPF